MLTLDQALEAVALALPRIGGDLSPYTLPLAITFEREIYPYLVGAVGVGHGGTKTGERLKTFADGLTHSARRQLLVRALDVLVTDAYATLAASGHAMPDPIEPMKAPERALVARLWSERAQTPSWRALLDALTAMANFAARAACGCDLKATDGNHTRTCAQRGEGQ